MTAFPKQLVRSDFTHSKSVVVCEFAKAELIVCPRKDRLVAIGSLRNG